MGNAIVLRFKKSPISILLVLAAAILAFQSLFVTFASAQTTGALTSRRVELSDNRIYNASPVRGDNVQHTYTFTVPTGGLTIGSMSFDFCTTPQGTCTAWSGNATINTPPFTSSTISGFAFGTRAAGQFRITRTAGSVAAGSYNVVLGNTTNGIRNPNASCNGSVNACTFFVRISTYSDSAYTTLVDTSVVAASVNTQATVSFKVQEILDFCVGTLRNSASGTGGGSIITPANFSTTNFTANNLTDCDGTGIGSPSIDLGIASPTTVRSAPVVTTAGIEGSDNYGLAMVSTNAANGTVIGYRPIQDTSSGALKVAGATCSGTSTTDQCINSAGTPGADTFPTATAGTSVAIDNVGTTEFFGMTVPAVNNSSSSRSTTNLTRAGDYVGNGNGTAGSCTANAGDCWLWSPTTGDFIATAATAVDFEALMLDFAAKASQTTPPGVYTVNIDFYAVTRY